MGTASHLASVRAVVASLLSWAERCGLAPSGALAIRGAAGRTELEGGGPAVARVADVAGYEYVQIVAGAVVAVYRSQGNGAASVWAQTAHGVAPPVDGVTSGTAVLITTGSTRVTCG